MWHDDQVRINQKNKFLHPIPDSLNLNLSSYKNSNEDEIKDNGLSERKWNLNREDPLRLWSQSPIRDKLVVIKLYQLCKYKNDPRELSHEDIQQDSMAQPKCVKNWHQSKKMLYTLQKFGPPWEERISSRLQQIPQKFLQKEKVLDYAPCKN